MLQFIQDYYVFIITVGSTILALIVAYFIYNNQYRKKAPIMIKPEESLKRNEITPVEDFQENENSNEIQIAEETIVDDPTPEPESVVLPESKSTPSPLVEQQVNPEITPSLKKDEIVDVDSSIKEEAEDENSIEDELSRPTKKTLGKYHVVFRQNDQMWVVKREGSDKIIRSLHTQKEAIAYATIKALSQDTTFVIHKKDGKIRKQNYTKTTK